MVATVGGEEVVVNEETCREVFRGKMTPMGCLINARTESQKKEEFVSVFPLRVRRYPVLVEGKNLVDLTTDAGKWENVYTYVIKE